MKFSAILLGAALYLFSSVKADISTNTPFNGVTWNGGSVEKVEWSDDGKAPPLEQIGLTSVDLFAGDSTTQFLAANIGKVPATAKTISFNVPKDVGPPGNFYFIKYTAAPNFTAFSGSFTIANVNGNINGFNPKSLNNSTSTNSTSTATPQTNGTAANPNGTNSTSSSSNSTSSSNPYGSSPSSSSSSSSSPSSSPSTPSAPSAPPTTANAKAQTSSTLPPTISSDAANIFPSFVGVVTAAFAFAFTYLY